jgi:archaemetzincin
MKFFKALFRIPALLLFVIIFGCSDPVPKTIHIQPLGKVSPIYIQMVKESVRSFYGYNCVIKPQIAVTNAMLSRVTKRIDATKALSSNKTSENLLFLTERDICHYNKKKAIPEYGIIGLGAISGKTAIISTFRLKEKGVSQQKILERLEKVALHEIGHNFGAIHDCSNLVNLCPCTGKTTAECGCCACSPGCKLYFSFITR